MDVRDYFMKKYKIIIPTSSSISVTCTNDITYGEWIKNLTQPTIYLKSNVIVKELYQHKYDNK